jgi:undecaprenyl-diphosphatase
MLNIIILAVIQGLTEFLPISSSGHLVLLHNVLDEDITSTYSKIIDISVHIGTLAAVILYFRHDVVRLLNGCLNLAKLNTKTNDAQLTLKLAIASIPVVIAGYILFQFNPTFFDSLFIMAWMTLVFGLVLYISDKRSQDTVKIDNFTFKQSFIYGLAQCAALIPGVSRSGITMTAGRFMGHSRVEAARFSLLMGMIAISGAGILASHSVIDSTTVEQSVFHILAVGMLVSFITAYIAILVMMRWISRASFTPFVIYRIILGCALLALLYSGTIPQDI